MSQPDIEDTLCQLLSGVKSTKELFQAFKIINETTSDILINSDDIQAALRFLLFQKAFFFICPDCLHDHPIEAAQKIIDIVQTAKSNALSKSNITLKQLNS